MSSEHVLPGIARCNALRTSTDVTDGTNVRDWLGRSVVLRKQRAREISNSVQFAGFVIAYRYAVAA